MNLDQFYASTNGQSLLYGNDPANRGQCVQLVATWVARAFGPNYVIWDDAYGWWADGRLSNLWERIPNNPNDPNQVPPRGAVVVFRNTLPGSGGLGHVDICWQATPGAATWIGYDSNWGGKTAHLVTHNWQYVVGWLVPKNTFVAPTPPPATPQGGDEMIANEAQAHQAYQLLRIGGDGSPAEIAATAGKRTWQGFANDAKAEIAQRNANYQAQQNTLGSMQATINSLNQTITELRTKENADADDLRAAQEKISYLTSQLESQHDKLAEQQTADVTIPQAKPTQPQANGLTKTILLLLEVRNKFKKK